MKKIYIEPNIAVVIISTQHFLAVSLVDENATGDAMSRDDDWDED